MDTESKGKSVAIFCAKMVPPKGDSASRLATAVSCYSRAVHDGAGGSFVRELFGAIWRNLAQFTSEPADPDHSFKYPDGRPDNRKMSKNKPSATVFSSRPANRSGFRLWPFSAKLPLLDGNASIYIQKAKKIHSFAWGSSHGGQFLACQHLA
jgi:hypothetical protein